MDNSTNNGKRDESEKLLAQDEEENPKLSIWRQRLMIVVLLAVQYSALCTDTFIYPFFPQEARIKGLSFTQIGLVFSAFEFSRFIVSLIAGYMIGKLNPKIFCIIGGTLTTLCCVSFGLITYGPVTLYLPLCILTRLIAGSGTAMLSVAIMTILLKGTSYESGTIAGLVEMMQSAGYATGPALGAGLYELGGYTCMFWFMGSLMAIINIIQIFVVSKLEAEPTKKQNPLHLLKIPGIVIIFFNSFFSKISGSSTSTGLSIFVISAFDKRSSIVALMLGYRSVIYLIACPFISKLVNKGYIFSTMIIGGSVSIMTYLLTGPSPILNFIFHGKKYFVLTAVMMAVAPMVRPTKYIPAFASALNIASVNGYQRDSTQTCGMISGVISSALGLGAMIGPTMSGAITQELDFTWTLTVIAAMETFMMMIMIAYLVVMKITNRPLRPEDMDNLREEEAECAERMADKLNQCFTEAVKESTTSETVQPQKEK